MSTQTKRIPLTQGRFAIVDAEDYEQLAEHKWHAVREGHSFYAARRYGGRIVKMHREILNAPPHLQCDHINHNGLDNRKANLRPATPIQNVWNRRKFRRPSRSKYKGVDWAKDMRRWRARIRFKGKRIYLGSFEEEIDAAKAYDRAARKYHAEFASLNFPESASS